MGKKKANQLGRSLIKDRFSHTNRKKVDNDTMLHTTEVQDGYDWGRLNLQSVTEESSFHEFLRTAELAGTEFQAEKLNITYVNPKSKVGLLTDNERSKLEKKHVENKDLLKIPRRPKWTVEMSAEELQTKENENFLEWRRNLALLQEQDELLLTPYEKNLNFWRQLWRVVEKSDIIIQIVDARNPLLFRNEDLEKYVLEVSPNKMNMILVNKADFLTDTQRRIWAEYFDRNNIFVAFFSAVAESETDENEDTDTKPAQAQEVGSGIENIENGLKDVTIQSTSPSSKIKNNPNVLTRTELIQLFKTCHTGTKVTEGLTTVGLVGYPNVGKSSTINALMIEKKVSVSATPGKTKHFQTLFLDHTLLLCDCPGLVMPSFCTTKADMVLNGILPIDQLRDHVPSVNLLCNYIPRHVLEDKYGIIITKPCEGEDVNRAPFSEELLLAFSYCRGYMTANGQPDQSRGSRYVLKDFVNGKLLYCQCPPDSTQSIFHVFPDRSKNEIDIQSLPIRQQRAIKMISTTSADIDKDFFKSNSLGSHVQGKNDFITRASSAMSTIEETPDGNPEMIRTKKPKRERKEKLRVKYAYLDQH